MTDAGTGQELAHWWATKGPGKSEGRTVLLLTPGGLRHFVVPSEREAPGAGTGTLSPTTPCSVTDNADTSGTS